jgi:maleate isomerase
LWVKTRHCRNAEADGVLIAGNCFRCVAIIETLEQDLKRPVITANQASLWHCLRLSGVRTPVSGYGGLLGL